MTDITIWKAGQRVEVFDIYPPRRWAEGEVIGQAGYYVKVRRDDDGHELVTYHLNVREPHTPDPVSQLWEGGRR